VSRIRRGWQPGGNEFSWTGLIVNACLRGCLRKHAAYKLICVAKTMHGYPNLFLPLKQGPCTTKGPELFQALCNGDGTLRTIKHAIESKLDMILELRRGINHTVQFAADLKISQVLGYNKRAVCAVSIRTDEHRKIERPSAWRRISISNSEGRRIKVSVSESFMSGFMVGRLPTAVVWLASSFGAIIVVADCNTKALGGCYYPVCKLKFEMTRLQLISFT